MDYREDNVPVEHEDNFDTLEFAVRLVSWIPGTLKDLMHSDDNGDIVFLIVCISLSILAIRTKNDIIGGK